MADKETMAIIKQMVADGQISQEVAEKYFPELKEKESEDEKIRKHLINYFKHKTDDTLEYWEGIAKEDALAWLEKQGEHANFCNKIQIGDKVTRNKDGVLVNLSQLNRVAKKQGEQILANSVKTCKDEQKPSDKLEPKFKVGDEIKTTNGESLTITRIDRWGYWSEDLFICDFDGADKWELVEQKPADNTEAKGMNIVEEDMTPFQKKVFCIIDTTIEEEQGLKQVCDELLRLAHDEIMQKPAEWNKEDIFTLDFLVDYLSRIIVNASPEENIDGLARSVTLLKAIKDGIIPRPHWKPSEEQMKCLSQVKGTDDHVGYVLCTLYNDLKKLTE